MADDDNNGLSVDVPEDAEDADGNGLSLTNFDDDEEEDVQDVGASPQSPNTLRNQYDVNSPRTKGDKGQIPGGWAATNEENGGDAGGDAGASGGGKGLESLVTQVSRDDDPAAQIMTQVSKDDSGFKTEQEIIQKQNAQNVSCFAALFCCASSTPPTDTSTQPDETNSTSLVSKSKPDDAQAAAGSSSSNKAAKLGSSSPSASAGTNAKVFPSEKAERAGGDRDESYTETEYASPGLLPPLLPEHEGKKCLVLDLDETLVHSSFKPIPNPDFIIPVEVDNVVHRVYVMKRPYVDEFLIECAKDYEVVVFTASLAKYADPLLDKLDPHKTITHRLFRESCVLHGRAYVKDMTTLGRKLRNAIIVDNSPASYLFQPINAIPILSWFDDQTDTQLRDLIPCLQTTLKNIRDVRNVLDANTKSYRWLCQQAHKDLSNFGE